MAVTKLWKIKGSITRPIKYIKNSEKTENPNFTKDDLQGLRDVMNYTTNDFKTEKQYYVSGVNVSSELAREQMIITKKRFGKEDGIVAYHGYQSFKENEVSSDTAQEIGIKLAKELWGDFEVVVATHLNTNCIHNHFVINSVSFKDGKKFNHNKAAYRKMREVSDKLCLEYGLSVITEPGRSNHAPYNIIQAEKQGKPTWYNVIRADVDMAIQGSVTFGTFCDVLKRLGYEIKLGKYVSVRPKGKERFVRLKTLGANYTEEAIKFRIRNTPLVFLEKPAKPVIKSYKFKGIFKAAKKITGFRSLYLYYMYLLGKIMKTGNTPKTHPVLKSELIKFELYKSQFKLIYENKFNTMTQVDEFINLTLAQIKAMTDSRNELNKILYSPKLSDNLAEMKEERTHLTSEMASLRKKLKLAYYIKESSVQIRENLKTRIAPLATKRTQYKKYEVER